MNVRPAAAFFVCLTFVALAACGGGGGGGGTMPQPSPQPSSSQGAHLSCNHTFSASRAALSFMRIGNIGAHFPASEQESIAPSLLGVRFQGTAISPQAQAALTRLGARQLSPLNENGAATFSIHADPRAAAMTVGYLPGVAAASPVILRHLSTIPNDPDFVPDQWDMNVIGMPAVWSTDQGLQSIRIAIIDTGYDIGNRDLMGKVDKSVVFDLKTGQQDVSASIEDKDGHGSDTSGIAAANTNNLIDVAGTGWNVHLLEARVFPYGSNSAQSNDIGAAIDWARTNGANVISLSLGSSSPDPTFEEPAVQRAIAAGITVVAASGNGIKVGNTFVGQPVVDFPAADPGVVSVGASAYCDQVKGVMGPGDFEYVAGYSNYGAGLTLVAPGGDPDATQSNCTGTCTTDSLQWITNLDSKQGQFHEEVSLFSGTSQSTPHVAGVVALMLAKHPGLAPAQVLSILQSTADNIHDSHQGSGRLNALSALNATPP